MITNNFSGIVHLEENKILGNKSCINVYILLSNNPIFVIFFQRRKKEKAFHKTMFMNMLFRTVAVDINY